MKSIWTPVVAAPSSAKALMPQVASSSSAHPIDPREAQTPGRVEIYSAVEEMRWRAALVRLGGEPSERIGRIATAVPRGPLMRALAPVPADSMIDELERRFPNFVEPIESIRNARALCTAQSGMRLAPLLLDGPPGVGKTAFVRALGRMLLAPPIMLNMASATAGFALGGLDLRWSTGAPGLIFDALVLADQAMPANRLVLVDEIDKVGSDLRNNPIGPLYALTEPSTARSFRDEAVDIALDASALIWVATSNRLDDIPDALRSRFETVHVTMPRAEQMPAVVQSAWMDLRAEESWWGARFPEQLDDEVVHAVCKLNSVREFRAVLRRAAGMAAREQSTVIRRQDVRAVAGKGLGRPARIGFM